MPNPVDKSFETLDNSKVNNFTNDVFFAISHGVHRGILKKGKFDERENFIDKLQSIVPNIKFDLYGMKESQPIWADDFINALKKSRIGLNLSQGRPIKFYSSDRIAQLIGNGLLVMLDEKTKFKELFSNKEVIFYKNINDLAKKINFYIIHNKLRKKIASRGRNKYFKYFNSTIVADYIIHKTYKISKRFYWDKK